MTHNYQQKYISTGVWLYPNQWDKGKIVNCDNIIKISKTLDKMVTDVRQVIYDMIEEGNIDIMQISNRLDAKNKLSLTFIDYCKQRATMPTSSASRRSTSLRSAKR